MKYSSADSEETYRIPGDSFVKLSTFLGYFTLFGCYLIAASLGHVPWCCPMISDCAVYAPESYLFRFGFITTAFLLAVGSLLMYTFLFTETLGGPQKVDKVALVSSLIASLGLAIVGSVNEKENNTIHSTAACFFFGGYWLYMYLTTKRLAQSSNPNHTIKPQSITIKTGLTTLTFIALMIFALMCIFYGQDDLICPICEWTATLCIIAYNVTYVFEWTNLLWLSSIVDDPSPSSQRLSNVSPQTPYIHPQAFVAGYPVPAYANPTSFPQPFVYRPLYVN